MEWDLAGNWFAGYCFLLLSRCLGRTASANGTRGAAHAALTANLFFPPVGCFLARKGEAPDKENESQKLLMPADQVFAKFKAGRLHSGSKSGPVVNDRKQAIAIFLSEKRASKSKPEYRGKIHNHKLVSISKLRA